MSSERRLWQNPDEIIETIGVIEGMTIADLGCGPGYFTLPISVKVGKSGKVYAVDANPIMVQHLKANLLTCETEGNVVVIQSDVSATGIQTESVDVIVFANILHDLENKDSFLHEVRRIAKSSAKIIDIDWHKRQSEIGPPFEKRLTEQKSREILRQNSLRVVRAISAGANHYGFICEKSAGGEI